MEARTQQHVSDAIRLIRRFMDSNGPEVQVRYGIDWDVQAALLQDEAELKEGKSVALLEYVNDTPVGVLVIKKSDKASAELKRMYVSPPHRRKGIGRSLLEEALQWARSGGYSHVRLYSAGYLHPSHAAYRDVGFKEVEAYSESGIPRSLTGHFVFMELEL